MDRYQMVLWTAPDGTDIRGEKCSYGAWVKYADVQDLVPLPEREKLVACFQRTALGLSDRGDIPAKEWSGIFADALLALLKGGQG